jgi:hypothetical protein
MNTTKQPKVYLHYRKPVLSRSERIELDKWVDYFENEGYPSEIALQRAWDCLYAIKRHGTELK